MSVTFQDVVERFRASSLSNRERGDKFEALVRSYLLADPLYAGTFDEVVLWSDWAGRDGRPDTGIDIVARESATGDLWAVQCKFYEPGHTIGKRDIDSFLAASGKRPFANRLIVSTTDLWNVNAEEALVDQQIPVTRIGLADMQASAIDWSWAGSPTELEVELRPAKRHGTKPHQEAAIEAVFAGFETRSRGKLIMACGTGKTFTSLAIAERLAAESSGAAQVLFLVPSLALLGQTLKEWSANAQLPLHAFAVGSDPKIGKARATNDLEDIRVHDLAIPATTDAAALAAAIGARPREGLTVVFSTYHSIAAVAGAQRRGVAEFDLIICDEAHRTTGLRLKGGDDSHFVKVHDQAFIAGRRRLYMTATPRIYTEFTKKAASDADAVLTSMDDEDLYGPEFHRLSFGQAVAADLLTDYKVLVLTVSKDLVADVMQNQLADENVELNLDDVAKVIGCWNGLAKRVEEGSGLDFTGDPEPMHRAVAFLSRIKDSEQFAEEFGDVVSAYKDAPDGVLGCEVRHVDGGMNAMQRGERLEWLKAPVAEDECRILSNARCLSEGVDVPDLDAVLFLSPRGSEVDVVQSVGRVMRKPTGGSKKYGYIVLPVAIPSGISPEDALRDHKRFRSVWQVLQGLRAHDERFDALVNTIELNPSRAAKKIGVAHITEAKADAGGGASTSSALGGGGTSSAHGDDGSSGAAETAAAAATADGGAEPGPGAGQLSIDVPTQWRDAIYARIVQKVGRRTYWEDWAHDVADIAEAQQERIRALLSGAHPDVTAAFDRFVEALRANLNGSISEGDAIGMLSQHLITKPVFDALFEDYEFAAHNPVSLVMDEIVRSLGDAQLGTETDRLEDFYRSVRLRAEGIDNAEGKQRIITELYEQFFRKAFKKTAESLGIVYTPVEIVDYILRAANDALGEHFGTGLTDEGVHVLDPFTGTGTFIARLLQSGLIDPKDLLRKYTQELHANEILLLAYYIAAVNIEATYHAVAGGDYVPFEGIALTDTFQVSEEGDLVDHLVMPANNARVERQLATDITVIVGNPPYSVGQSSANDSNENLKYPTLDGRIEATYAARSTASSKRTLYDSYVRAIRWATDRVGERGVIAFVTNGGWIDGNTADGIRLSLADEFSALYVYNLRGNQRTAGELSRKEGGKVFGSGSRNTVGVLVGVRDPAHDGPPVIRYRDVGDYLTREEKLATIAGDSLAGIEWIAVAPNEQGDWIHQRKPAFRLFPALSAAKTTKELSVLSVHSLGLATNRDAWVYAAARETLVAQVKTFVAAYADLSVEFNAFCDSAGITRPTADDARRFVAESPAHRADPTRISWSSGLMQSLARGRTISFDKDAVRIGTYRPFERRWTYFDSGLNDRRGKLPEIFPTSQHQNVGFYVVGAGSDVPFSVLMLDAIPNLHVTGGGSGGQFFPRWSYERQDKFEAKPHELFEDGAASAEIFADGYNRVDNVTDVVLADYRKTLGPTITKDEIFDYVYGVLHSPQYRENFAADLKKMLPRIPKVASLSDFSAFAEAGHVLAELHLGYEDLPRYPLNEHVTECEGVDPYELYRVEKIRFAANGDRTELIYNRHLTLAGIPEDAHRYKVGARSAIEWILERYRVTTHRESGIVNDPNAWSRGHEHPRYIVDLLESIITLSLETMRIVDSLPDLHFDT